MLTFHEFAKPAVKKISDTVSADYEIHTPYNSQSYDIDGNTSKIYACVTKASIINDHKSNSTVHTSRDMAINGYTFQGLPFQIIINGADSNRNNENNHILDLLHHDLTNILFEYTQELTKAEPSMRKAIVQRLRTEVQEITRKKCGTEKFSLSLFTTYQYENEIFVAGAGLSSSALGAGENEEIPPPGIARKTFNVEEIQQLVSPIDKTSIFHIPVFVNDEIVGYTVLPDAMHTTNTDNKLNLEKIPQQKDTDYSLFTRIVSNIPLIMTSQFSYKTNATIGDDCTVVSSTIPDAVIQSNIVDHMRLKQISELRAYTNRYIAWMRENVIDKGFFSSFHHGRSGLARAEKLQKMLKDTASSYEAIFTELKKAFNESGYQKHSYSRYIAAALYPNYKMTHNKTDDEFNLFHNIDNSEFKAWKNEFNFDSAFIENITPLELPPENERSYNPL